VRAATATQAQLKGVLGLSDSAAWKTVAVTPMVGLDDGQPAEPDVVGDPGPGTQQCAGGAKKSADATCGSIVQAPFAFSKAFAAHK
jgi:hypothetical protein